MTEALTWMAANPDKVAVTIAALLGLGLAALLVEYLIERRK